MGWIALSLFGIMSDQKFGAQEEVLWGPAAVCLKSV